MERFSPCVVLFSSLFFSVFPTAAWSAAPLGLQVGVGIEAFTWEETITGAAVSPKEQGGRVALNLGWKQDKDIGTPYLAYEGKIYGGTVDYTTTTMSGVPSPTSTDYAGMVNELRGVIPVGIMSATVGLGYDFWSRSIGNTVTSGGLYVQGYTEKFDIFFLRLGLSANLLDKVEIAGGIKSTISNSEELPYNLGTIHPGSSMSPYWDVTYRYSRNFNLAAYYDSWRFSESRASGTGFYQPASRMSVIGAKAAWLF